MNRMSMIAAGLSATLAALPASAGERLQVVERALSDTTLDLGAKGDSPGDLLTFANPIFDAANKARVRKHYEYSHQDDP